VGPTGGDAARLLERHDAGTVVDWNDPRTARNVIQTHYQAWADGTPQTGASLDALAEHTRRRQAERMAEVLSETTEGERIEG
jgi:hypothetical protein